MCLKCKKLPEGTKCPAMLALERLTPGGSEFWEDPIRCADMIRNTRTTLMNILAQYKKALNPEYMYNLGLSEDEGKFTLSALRIFVKNRREGDPVRGLYFTDLVERVADRLDKIIYPNAPTGEKGEE